MTLRHSPGGPDAEWGPESSDPAASPSPHLRGRARHHADPLSGPVTAETGKRVPRVLTPRVLTPRWPPRPPRVPLQPPHPVRTAPRSARRTARPPQSGGHSGRRRPAPRAPHPGSRPAPSAPVARPALGGPSPRPGARAADVARVHQAPSAHMCLRRPRGSWAFSQKRRRRCPLGPEARGRGGTRRRAWPPPVRGLLPCRAQPLPSPWPQTFILPPSPLGFFLW